MISIQNVFCGIKIYSGISVAENNRFLVSIVRFVGFQKRILLFLGKVASQKIRAPFLDIAALIIEYIRMFGSIGFAPVIKSDDDVLANIPEQHAVFSGVGMVGVKNDPLSGKTDVFIRLTELKDISVSNIGNVSGCRKKRLPNSESWYGIRRYTFEV